ncbi:MAG: ribonuclease J, partial [Clostridia bacterium]|nr:ribonuclease J [Clostridia bacterium]
MNEGKKYSRYSKVVPPVSADPIKVSFLGGINEVGKNMTCYEYAKSMLIVDCGLAFPESDQLGVDFVIPDFTFVERNADRVKGVLITHGHEDHIGALCYLLKKVNIPVYATKLTAGLIMGKLEEHNLQSDVSIHIVKAGDVITLGDFEVEFIKVNHSIPDAVALAIKTQAG